MRFLGDQRLQAVVLYLVITPHAAWAAEQPDAAALGDDYQSQIRPLLDHYCVDCHGAAGPAEGEIDLAALGGWDEAARHPELWQKVAEMLGNGLMPPEEAEQPTDDERARLRQWVSRYLAVEAQAHAGDPGRVILRRLSNAEYTYTLRDLTGVESLDPAREFPVDGAAGEGFTNTGGALVMSPELLTKYLDAAKEVASHAVLLPDGFRFSPHTTTRDWTDETLAMIREFYSQFTDASGGSVVNLQGIILETNQGGRLPVEKYLAATLVEREALATGRKTIDEAARQHGLNAKYLRILWTALTSADPSVVLDRLRAQWHAAKPEDAAALAAEIARWQQCLWTFSSVGLIGREGGPQRWMEPVDPLTTKQELRFKIPESPTGAEVTVSLVATPAGDGVAGDVVVWQAPRLVAPGRPDVLLRDSDGVDAAMFGRHPEGRAVDPADLYVQAPSVVEVRLPADKAAGCELVTSGMLDSQSGAEGSVQLAIVAGRASAQSDLLPGENVVSVNAGVSWSDGKTVASTAPIIVTEGSEAQRRYQTAFAEHRRLFPPALCYTKIVPVDEVISATLFYREDDHLVRLMLNDAQRQQLDRLWDDLHFVSRDALTSVDAFAQLLEFASQDANPKVFEPLRQPINDRADAFRQRLIDCEPIQVDALIDFAARPLRRPLTGEEGAELRELYDRLRDEGMSHEEAFRLTLARVLVGPAFLYRVEKPVAGSEQGPVSDWELACRLSYFLWSSQPDDELRVAAAAGRLQDPEELVSQMRRMLSDAKTRRLAIEFACQWLQINDFENLEEKSDRHFPTFADLRGDMAEESIQFFTDLFRSGGSVLDILEADYTFLNEDLARHYGIPDVTGAEWRRVDGVKKFNRGGVLALAATLAKQSGASRTSPILRGTWISEVLLGERLPKPPPGIPPLPDDEAGAEGLTVRQLVEKHVSDPDCAVCHRRIDPYGFSLEAFDAIGRWREKDLGDRPVDSRVTAMDGAEFDGLEGLRSYLLTNRRDAFLRQFCRKLLGYALGRTVQLSDDPLLEDMQRELADHDFKVDAAVETIVRSRQFREIRGMETAFDE
jgi:hypothetical protein